MHTQPWAKRLLLLATLSLLAAAGCTDEEDATGNADAAADTSGSDTSSGGTSGSTAEDASDTSSSGADASSSGTDASSSGADTSGTTADTEDFDSNVPVDTVTNLDTDDTDDADTDDADTDDDDADTDDADTDDADTDDVDTDDDTDTETDTNDADDDADVPPPPTYTDDIQPIYQANCSTCHTRATGCSGGACFGFSYAETQKASNVCPGLSVGECTLVRTTNGSMPQISASDRQRLQDWITAGMPE